MKIVTGLLDRLLFAAGLILFLQIPQFIDHYTQRYAGYRQALADSVQQYQTSATAHYDGDLRLMIHEFQNADAPAMRDMGRKMERERVRLDEMTAGLAVLRGGSLPAKLAHLAQDIDMPLARATFEDYRPAADLGRGRLRAVRRRVREPAVQSAGLAAAAADRSQAGRADLSVPGRACVCPAFAN
jgi:hypothetical protein